MCTRKLTELQFTLASFALYLCIPLGVFLACVRIYDARFLRLFCHRPIEHACPWAFVLRLLRIFPEGDAVGLGLRLGGDLGLQRISIRVGAACFRR